MSSVLWFRRDLRLHDHPALHAAAAAGPVTPLFVLDDALLKPSGAPRVASLLRALRALDDDLSGALVVRHGDPANVVPRVAAEAKADVVHISADFGPYGAGRDERVEQALDVPLVRTGSPYAISPGRVLKNDGTPFKVFTPFYKAWLGHGWRAPAGPPPKGIEYASLKSDDVPADPDVDGELPDVSERAALTAWRSYQRSALGEYADVRDRPDLDRTSRMSVHLKWGTIHPRTLLADLGTRDETYRKELAWREFYASVLHHWPDSAREYFQPAMAAMDYDDPGERFTAWQQGRTGYPIVDAGMRQLLAEGWMHNRVRMIVASFLVKDLHIEWTHGARHFMAHLVDGDLASNQHGWQWTAGTGTDAAPYFRIFNPTSQARRFDPDGNYVRRWIPELREIDGGAVHEPWALREQPKDYPAPIVEHSVERDVALERYRATKTQSG